MTTAHRLAILTTLFVGTLTLPALAPGPDVGNWEKLRSMPREQRLHLAAQLKIFDGLGPDEQAALRAIDRALAAEPEGDRENDFAVLRRYHLWVQSLPEVRRGELKAATPEARLALARKYRAEQRTVGAGASQFLKVADFRGVSPYVLAHLIQVWFSLKPAQQAEVTGLPENDRGPRLHQLGKTMKPIARRPNSAKVHELYDHALKAYPFLKKAEAAKNPEQFKQRLADHFAFLETPPPKVAPDKLLAFDRALPVWVRGGIDTLPPEEARRRLTVLYRLVYSDGEKDAAKTVAPRSKGNIAPHPPRPAVVPGKAAPPNPSPY